jgi:hypothetical protein
MHFSPSENRLMAVLAITSREAPLTTVEIAYRLYGEEAGRNARLYVGQMVRSLVEKTRRRRKVPRVRRSKREGHKPMKVWVER